MAVLLRITLISLLGILKGTSAGYETMHMEFKDIEEEVKCSLPNLNLLIEDYPKLSSIIKDAADLKDSFIQELNDIIVLGNKYECGKEMEDKTRVAKFIISLKGLEDVINYLRSVYHRVAVEAMNSVSETASLALNELSCCCKAEVCIKKLEYPYAKLKEPIKECQPEKCNSQLCEFIRSCAKHSFLIRAINSRLLLEQCLEEYQKLSKAKDEIPKEGKCNEEAAASLFQKTQTVQLCFEKLTGQQLSLYESYNASMSFYAMETMTELIQYTKASLKEKKD